MTGRNKPKIFIIRFDEGLPSNEMDDKSKHTAFVSFVCHMGFSISLNAVWANLMCQQNSMADEPAVFR